MNWQKRVISTEVRKILAYRSDFWVNFFGQTMMQLFIAYSLWTAIFAAIGAEEMRGLTLPQITLYYLLAPLSMKILMGENIGFLAREIYDGGLNRYLVWPMPPLGYKLLTYLTYSGFYLIQLAILYTLGRFFLDGSLYTFDEGLRLIVGIGYLFVAAFAYFCLMCLCEMVAFWADNTWTLGVMLRFVGGFLGGAYLPLAFFPEIVRDVLEYLPFAAMVSGPVNLILGKATWGESFKLFVVLLCWIPALALLVKYVWKRGNHQYTGVGM